MELVQLLISGISQGCVYGLIALGFVLIYKATEMVNFAQGDLMMLGAFIAFGSSMCWVGRSSGAFWRHLQSWVSLVRRWNVYCCDR